ncbi:hypothetical protein R3P38DRAFT_518962 [Favolaschia claudopus]|uniref:Uncharacterized protein n=1 Tax=Favolaschia claudopus TaxID=2862362 RepID=A0AAV9ZBT4_9AGAR
MRHTRLALACGMVKKSAVPAPTFLSLRCLVPSNSVTYTVPSSYPLSQCRASAYIVAAAIDLILKSRTIARLGDQASQSNFLPALVCAERVVSLGTGSSLFTLTMAIVYGPRQRTIVVASIPLTFALVASGFCLRAHNTISCPPPDRWCSRQGSFWPAGVGLPAATVIQRVSYTFETYSSEGYWLQFPIWSVGVLVGIAELWILTSIGPEAAFLGGILWIAFYSLLPLVFNTLFLLYLAGIWAVSWVVVWGLVFIVAFFPQMRFFPPTNISMLEMDQLAAPLAVVAVAVIRTARAIYRARYPPTSVTHSPGHEQLPLLPPFDFETDSR